MRELKAHIHDAYSKASACSYNLVKFSLQRRSSCNTEALPIRLDKICQPLS